MKPGDIVVWRDRQFGRNRFWEVRGVFLGGLDQESVVELLSLTERPAHSGIDRVHPTTFVPEPLLRDVEIFKPYE
jgi:hypothetical protein